MSLLVGQLWITSNDMRLRICLPSALPHLCQTDIPPPPHPPSHRLASFRASTAFHINQTDHPRTARSTISFFPPSQPLHHLRDFSPSSASFVSPLPIPHGHHPSTKQPNLHPPAPSASFCFQANPYLGTSEPESTARAQSSNLCQFGEKKRSRSGQLAVLCPFRRISPGFPALSFCRCIPPLALCFGVLDLITPGGTEMEGSARVV